MNFLDWILLALGEAALAARAAAASSSPLAESVRSSPATRSTAPASTYSASATAGNQSDVPHLIRAPTTVATGRLTRHASLRMKGVTSSVGRDYQDPGKPTAWRRIWIDKTSSNSTCAPSRREFLRDVAA